MNLVEWCVLTTTPAVPTPCPRVGTEDFPTLSSLNPPGWPVWCYFCFHLADVEIQSQGSEVPFLGLLMSCSQSSLITRDNHRNCRTRCQAHSNHSLKIKDIRSHQLEMVKRGLKPKPIHFQPHALFLLSGVSRCLSPLQVNLEWFKLELTIQLTFFLSFWHRRVEKSKSTGNKLGFRI